MSLWILQSFKVYISVAQNKYGIVLVIYFINIYSTVFFGFRETVVSWIIISTKELQRSSQDSLVGITMGYRLDGPGSINFLIHHSD
jgi:hypothetical protein